MTVIRGVESPGFWAIVGPTAGRALGTIVLVLTPLEPGGNNGSLLRPLINPHPFPNLDPLRKPEDDEDGNKQTYIYETGRSVKSFKPNDFTPGTTLPYFGITDNAFIAGIAVGRYSKQAEEAKNLPLFGGIIGKTDRATALGVEYALIALNTYGKGFDKKILSGKLNPSSVDVYNSRRIDNLIFTTTDRQALNNGVRWLKKHYGKNWQDTFYHPDNPAQNTNSGPSPGASDNTNHVTPVRNPGG